MTPRRSAGLLVYRRPPAPAHHQAGALEVLLGHLGGPFWASKDEGAWSIPKGEYDGAEPALVAARREFAEEVGLAVPDGPLTDLGEVRQSGGKLVTVWAVEGDLDPARAVSNTFTLEWPPRSGRLQEFPELDRVAWLGLPAARVRLVKGQVAFLDRLAERVGG